MLLYIARLVKINSENDKGADPQEQINNDIPTNNIQEPHAAENQKSKTTKNKKYRKTQKMKWRNKMLDISMIPKTVELDKDTLLPKSINRAYGYGKRFNSFVIQDERNLYHRSTCSYIKSSKKTLVHRYLASCKLLPCSNCTPNTIIDDWYIDFLKVNFEKFTTYEDFRSQLELSNAKLNNVEINLPN